jgi:hypothetical protein
MARFGRILALTLLASWQLGCGGAGPGTGKSGSAPVPAANISMSPANTIVGSPDLTLTVTGSQQFQFTSDPDKFNQVVWSIGEIEPIDTWLTTTFVSSAKLIAIVPANLLTQPHQARVRVEIWDPQNNVLTATSNSVIFNVPAPAPSISSISPASVAARSSDVRLTITGSNYYNDRFLNTSIAFWTTDPHNLHDHGTMLHTTLVNGGELKAVIPAALLQNPGSVQIVVLTGDSMGMSDGFFGYPESNSVTFTVTP